MKKKKKGTRKNEGKASRIEGKATNKKKKSQNKICVTKKSGRKNK